MLPSLTSSGTVGGVAPVVVAADFGEPGPACGDGRDERGANEGERNIRLGGAHDWD